MKRVLCQALGIVLFVALLTLARVMLEPGARALFKPPMLEDGDVLMETARKWNPPPVWIDARSRTAYERGHIADAFLLTLDEKENFEKLLFDLDKKGVLDGKRSVVVYCSSHSCQLSREVAARLRERYPALKVFVLYGGWR
jgi:rhodanese-related sulfurtransferase